MKKHISIILIFALLLSVTFIPTDYSYAAKSYSDQIDDLQDDLEALEKEQKQVSSDLTKVAKEITTLQNKVNSVTTKISTKTKEINATQKKIDAKQAEINEREEGLNERLVIMYKNGSIGFMDVLMGSNSISEFVSNMGMIQRIYKQDTEILSSLQGEHDELEALKAELKEKKAELAEQKAELAKDKIALQARKKVLEQKEDELQKQADKLTDEILKLIDLNSKYIGGTFTWPCPSSKTISSKFGNRLHPILKVYKLHTGIDVAAGTGKAIVAAASGKVILSQYVSGYGYTVMIDHGGGIVTLYGHCSKLIAKKGAIVKRGDTIAKVGSTGNSTGPHLHFEVRVNGEYVDPLKYVS